MITAQHLAASITVGAAIYATGGLLIAAVAARRGAPSMREAAAVTLRIVTGRGRRSVPISAPRPVAQPYMHPHIQAPIEQGCPLVMLGAYRARQQSLQAAMRSGQLYRTFDPGDAA